MSGRPPIVPTGPAGCVNAPPPNEHTVSCLQCLAANPNSTSWVPLGGTCSVCGWPSVNRFADDRIAAALERIADALEMTPVVVQVAQPVRGTSKPGPPHMVSRA